MKSKSKEFLRSLLLTAVIAGSMLLFLPPMKAAATGTDAGFILTNTATMTWGSGNLSMSVFNEVDTNYGGVWIGTNSALANVIAGNTVENEGSFTNEGNATADFYFNYSIVSGSQSVAWPAYLTNKESGGLGGASVAITGITPGGLKIVSLIVTIPSAETNGASNMYRMVASNYAASLQGAVRYTGSNGIVYGGDMGIKGAAAGTLFMSFGGLTNWTVNCLSASMQLARTYTFTNPAPYLNRSMPVPGALIFLKLAYTNGGASSANSLTIVDTFNTNKLAFFKDILKMGTFNDTYATAATSLTTNGDTDEGAYFGDNKVYFTPTGGQATNTTGNVGANGSGAFFYTMTLY